MRAQRLEVVEGLVADSARVIAHLASASCGVSGAGGRSGASGSGSGSSPGGRGRVPHVIVVAAVLLPRGTALTRRGRGRG